MVESYISENDVKNLVARLEATIELGKQNGIAFTKLGTVYYNPFDVLTAVSAERLDRSSKRLNEVVPKIRTGC